ncbi:16582_t:CDS:1, partial [Gigaspora rosea]
LNEDKMSPKTKQAIAQKKRCRHTEPVVKSPNSMPIAFSIVVADSVGRSCLCFAIFGVCRFVSGIRCAFLDL